MTALEEFLPVYKRIQDKLSKRKSKLFSCALARHPKIWPMLKNERSKLAIEIAERYAEGKATDEDIRLTSRRTPTNTHYEECKGYDIAWIACENEQASNHPLLEWIEHAPECPSLDILLELTGPIKKACERCGLIASAGLRDDGGSACPNCKGTGYVPLPINFGNKVIVNTFVCEKCNNSWIRKGVYSSWYICQKCGERNHVRKRRELDDWLTWNENTVLNMAKSIYENRAFENMPVLSDALLDASCKEEAIIDHLKSGYHARGCWVLDLLLGKK